MKFIIVLLLLVGIAFAAEETRTRFRVRDSLPVSVSLVWPSEVIAANKQTDTGDTIRAQASGDEDDGLVVEVTDATGRKLWSRDFGYSVSAPEGCEVTVACHPKLPLILVHYSGYKWNHDHRLLSVENTSTGTAIQEYSEAGKDILPFLRRQKGFNPDYEYWIYPSRFTESGIEFECVPLQRRERQAGHPFVQDARWYSVRTKVDQAGKIIPVAAKPTH